MLHCENLRGADEVGWRKLHVDRRARGVKRASQLIAHRQHLRIPPSYIIVCFFIQNAINIVSGQSQRKIALSRNNKICNHVLASGCAIFYIYKAWEISMNINYTNFITIYITGSGIIDFCFESSECVKWNKVGVFKYSMTLIHYNTFSSLMQCIYI